MEVTAEEVNGHGNAVRTEVGGNQASGNLGGNQESFSSGIMIYDNPMFNPKSVDIVSNFAAGDSKGKVVIMADEERDLFMSNEDRKRLRAEVENPPKDLMLLDNPLIGLICETSSGEPNSLLHANGPNNSIVGTGAALGYDNCVHFLSVGPGSQARRGP